MALNAIEKERLEVAETALNRLISLYKTKQRKNKELEMLRQLEQACNLLTVMRLL